VPDLAAIAESQWAAVLAEVPSDMRWKAMDRLPLERRTKALEIVLEVGEAEDRRRKAARDEMAFPHPLPGGSGPLPARRPERQVAFRLRAEQYDDLVEAAHIVGLKPAQLARMMTVRGVAQVLHEREAS
jgi:hypothetical protein